MDEGLHLVQMEDDSLNGYESNCLLENVPGAGGGRDFENVGYLFGADVTQDSRGVLVFDYDRDGDQDVFLACYRRRGVLLRNDFPARSWLQVRLVGRESNRDGVGARIEVECGGARQVREVRAGEAFISQGSLVQHFGLADATAVDALTVRWPSGHVDRYESLPVNRRITLTEASHVTQ